MFFWASIFVVGTVDHEKFYAFVSLNPAEAVKIVVDIMHHWEAEQKHGIVDMLQY